LGLQAQSSISPRTLRGPSVSEELILVNSEAFSPFHRMPHPPAKYLFQNLITAPLLPPNFRFLLVTFWIFLDLPFSCFFQESPPPAPSRLRAFSSPFFSPLKVSPQEYLQIIRCGPELSCPICLTAYLLLLVKARAFFIRFPTVFSAFPMAFFLVRMLFQKPIKRLPPEQVTLLSLIFFFPEVSGGDCSPYGYPSW